MRFRSLNEVPARLRAALEVTEKAPKRLKYGNHKCELDGETFDSKKERDRWVELRMLARTGEIRAVVRQVSIPLPHNRMGRKRRMWIDFMIVAKDGGIHWEDVKGIVTDSWQLKREIVEAAYGIKIETV